MSHEYDNYAAITVGLLMSDAEVAREVLHKLDAALHPWSDPGEIPREPGDYWACEDGHVFPMTVVGPRVFSGYVSDTARYRKRWKPAAMYTRGEVLSDSMTEEQFHRVSEWQVLHNGEWRPFMGDWHYVRQCSRPLLMRPAVFAQLDQQETR